MYPSFNHTPDMLSVFHPVSSFERHSLKTTFNGQWSTADEPVAMGELLFKDARIPLTKLKTALKNNCVFCNFVIKFCEMFTYNLWKGQNKKKLWGFTV
jgi:hypothetical protein